MTTREQIERALDNVTYTQRHPGEQCGDCGSHYDDAQVDLLVSALRRALEGLGSVAERAESGNALANEKGYGYRARQTEADVLRILKGEL
jgi:hypothetical protein